MEVTEVPLEALPKRLGILNDFDLLLSIGPLLPGSIDWLLSKGSLGDVVR